MSRTDLYRYFDCDNQLLYVGISLCAVARLCQHRTEKEWFGRIAKITIECFDDRASALAAERLAITQEKPIFNISSGQREPARLPKTLSASQAAELLGVDRGAIPIDPEPHWSGTTTYAPRYGREAIEAYLAGASA